MGFLSQDKGCSAGIEPPVNNGDSSIGDSSSGDDDDDFDGSTILGVAFGVLAAAIIALIICLVANERNRPNNKIEVL